MISILTICGKGPISQAINVQTWSDKSHTAILNRNSGQVIEALAVVPSDNFVDKITMRGRVVKRGLISYDPRTECYVQQIKNPVDMGKLWAFAESLVGTPYDYLGVLRFISRGEGRPLSEMERLFCSETGVICLRHVGIQVSWMPAYKHSPALLSATPDLTKPVKMKVGEIL